MDRGAWQGVVHRVAKSQMQLKRLGMQHAQYIDNKNVKLFEVAKLYWGWDEGDESVYGVAKHGGSICTCSLEEDTWSFGESWGMLSGESS